MKNHEEKLIFIHNDQPKISLQQLWSEPLRETTVFINKEDFDDLVKFAETE
jgi:hypothetical protein